MSTSNTSSVSFATQQITIFLGIPILTVGVLGEILNCIVFLSLKTFRENSCAFYLIIISFVNIGQLLTSLLPRTMIYGFDTDWTQTSSWYCKFRMYILQLCSLMSCTCMSLATMDQFFATCFKPRWQQLSNLKLARVLSFIFFIVWLFHGIPYLMYLNLIASTTSPNEFVCAMTNVIFSKYFQYGFIMTLLGFLPVSITVLFGILAYRNVQQLTYRAVPLIRRELDKQLTVMVLVQVVFNSFATLPYTILYVIMRQPYITNNSFRYTQATLAYSVFVHMYYLHYASSFYIYMCVSERFRRQLIYVLFEIHLNRWHGRMATVNQVSPS